MAQNFWTEVYIYMVVIQVVKRLLITRIELLKACTDITNQLFSKTNHRIRRKCLRAGQQSAANGSDCKTSQGVRRLWARLETNDPVLVRNFDGYSISLITGQNIAYYKKKRHFMQHIAWYFQGWGNVWARLDTYYPTLGRHILSHLVEIWWPKILQFLKRQLGNIGQGLWYNVCIDDVYNGESGSERCS